MSKKQESKASKPAQGAVKPSWVAPTIESAPVVIPVAPAAPVQPAAAPDASQTTDEQASAPIVTDTLTVIPEAAVVAPAAPVQPAAAKAPEDTVTVTCEKAFRCRLSHHEEHRIAAGVQEMAPDLAEKLAGHWYAKAHGFRIYKK